MTTTGVAPLPGLVVLTAFGVATVIVTVLGIWQALAFDSDLGRVA